MDQSEILKKVLCEEALNAEEKQAHIENLEADPDLARSLAGWQRFRAYMRDRIPSPRDFVLYSLVFGGHAEDLSEEEAAEVNEKWGALDSVIESDPGYSEVAAQIERDRQDFLTCWELEDNRSTARVLPLRTFRMAAAIAVLAVSVITILLLLNQRDVTLQVATVDPGEYERVLLPDGSIAHLNGPATLRFDEQNFPRSVELTGVALFDIAHQPDQFSVQTEEAVARVLGTRFGVRSMNGLTQIVLESGRLEVASKIENPQSVLLVPGQMTSIAQGSAAPTPPVEVNIEDQMGWTGFIFFRETSLRKAAVLLSTSRNIRVDFDPSLINERVTGTFAPDVTAEEILDALALTLNAEVLREGETYRIVP
ncbi:MAG: FecR domain-containing protein [Bacteroidetes bacterium]|nr:FecR domain-containing protein [Bacteroidota bacterium]